MDVVEVLELLEAGITFTELYRYLSNKYTHIDERTLLTMTDVAYKEYKEESE